MSSKKIDTALISVYNKQDLGPVIRTLQSLGIKIFSTGGTQKFIEDLEVEVEAVEDVTGYPSVFGGRVKTLHPKIFGGILQRSGNEEDREQASQYQIPAIDLVIVDLYPFEQTLASGATEEEIIEKIDIGGISLIRAAAKNFGDVLIISSRDQYSELLTLLEKSGGSTTLEDRKYFAAAAFDISSHYDTSIFQYFNGDGKISSFKQSLRNGQPLRYGENPHQNGEFFGDLGAMFDQLNGKALSYNNLIDVDAAVNLIEEFEGETTFAILKHNNPCGVASADTVKQAYLKALQADTVSAFGGVLVTNGTVDVAAAEELHKLFFEILIAPAYDTQALDLLKGKKNRILLKKNRRLEDRKQYRSLLGGVIRQDRDLKTDGLQDLKVVTSKGPGDAGKALLFANKVVKHTKSNAIVLANQDQLLATGVGQTSRVDALNQAIDKAKRFGFNLKGSVMASDAFFPFPDCVEIAAHEGIDKVIQPGGSIKDQESIDFCNKNDMAMVFTGTRHFKH